MDIKRMLAAVSLLGAATIVLDFGAPSALASGSVSLTTLDAAYTESFDTLASSGTSSIVPTGWDFLESGSNANTSYTAGTGSLNTGDTYSFGAASDTERAFGGLQSNSLVPTIGASFKNDTGSVITQLAIAYNGEQWRLGALARIDRLDFQYSTDATSLNTGIWVNSDSLDFTAPTTGPTVGALNGNAPANRTAIAGTVSGLNIPAGATFWIRWSDVNASGADDGLAVDDFSLTPSFTEQPPAVTATVPADGAVNVPLNSDVTVTFSEAVTVGSSWFTLTCDTSGPHTATFTGGPTTFTIQPDTDFAEGENCTLTVLADQVSDQDGVPPDNMVVNFTAGFSTVVFRSIHEIQGAAHLSPLNGQSVTTRPSLVTALRTAGSTRGFYLQDVDPDASDATSEGLFVFTGGSSNPASLVQVGDLVRVGGKVSEFRPAAMSLTITELVGPLTIDVISTGNPLPAPLVIGAGGRIPPNEVIEDDASGSVETSGIFDPATDGIDFYESLEGMLVEIHDAVATGPTSDFGSNREISVIGDGGVGAGVRTARGGVVIRPTDFNPERVILNDWIAGGPDLPDVDVGDSFPGDTIGVVDYSFGNFKLQVISMPALSPNGLQKEVTAVPSADELSVATFNVENLAPTDPPSKFARLAQLIVHNLAAPDVIAIEEIQDNNGTTNDGTVDASVTWNLLIAAIAAVDGTTYDYRQIDPVNGQDGGAPGGNIRQGFLFRTDRGLNFVDRPGGDSTTATGVSGSGATTHLTFSPGRIDPTNTAFTTSRKPLAAEFTFRGEHLFLIANHFNSKGGDDPLFGVTQPPVRVTETQRAAQAQVENDFVTAILAADPSANVVALGDINDFEFSNAMSVLAGEELHVLMNTLPPDERYSYDFEGNAQALDHTLISDALFARTFVYDVVHVNSEFSDQDSDHDPQVTRFALNDAPTVSASFAQPRVPCGVDNATLVVTFSDPDSDDTHTATIDWGDGTSTSVDSATSPFSRAHTYAHAGAYTATVTVTDAAGESGTATAAVAVDYTTSGVLQPINADGSSVFKYGSTIPVKVVFADCDGTTPSGLNPSISVTLLSNAAPVTQINEPVSTSAADAAGVMRFSNGQWIYNLATRPLPDPSARYLVTISLANGQVVTATFELRS